LAEAKTNLVCGVYPKKRLLSIELELCGAATQGDTDTVAALEAEIDRVAARLWGITADELKAIQDALREV